MQVRILLNMHPAGDRETLQVFMEAMMKDESQSINSQGGSLAPRPALHIFLKKDTTDCFYRNLVQPSKSRISYVNRIQMPLSQ